MGKTGHLVSHLPRFSPKGDDVTFWIAFFGIYNCRTSKQLTFLESSDKTGQNRYVFELDLTLGQIWKWVSSSNFAFQMTHKTCVTPYSCYIFMRWPHLTWPWPELSISLLLTWHLRHPFSSILAGFWLAAVSGLVSPTDKGNTSYIWPWPDLDPTFDLVKKILRLHHNSLVESFRSPPRAPRSAY